MLAVGGAKDYSPPKIVGAAMFSLLWTLLVSYMVIEVNPQVSRSSALASKHSGYPIAQVTTKAAPGLYLSEIINPLTGLYLCQPEPVMD